MPRSQFFRKPSSRPHRFRSEFVPSLFVPDDISPNNFDASGRLLPSRSEYMRAKRLKAQLRRKQFSDWLKKEQTKTKPTGPVADMHYRLLLPMLDSLMISHLAPWDAVTSPVTPANFLKGLRSLLTKPRLPASQDPIFSSNPHLVLDSRIFTAGPNNPHTYREVIKDTINDAYGLDLFTPLALPEILDPAYILYNRYLWTYPSIPKADIPGVLLSIIVRGIDNAVRERRFYIDDMVRKFKNE